MRVLDTEIPGVRVIEPLVHSDERGFFLESYNERAFRDALGTDARFCQDNHSRSFRGVLRGLHYQVRHAQGKLIRVVRGEIFDVAVDLRASSPTFGAWVGRRLSAENMRELWVEEGFAHGFLVLSDVADVLYKTTDYYSPEHERCLRWDDPRIGIAWPIDGEPSLSAKDRAGVDFETAEVYR